MTAAATSQSGPSSIATREVPRMKGHWFWGSLFDLVRDRSGFLIEGHEKYGDVFVARALTRDLMCVRDPAARQRDQRHVLG